MESLQTVTHRRGATITQSNGTHKVWLVAANMGYGHLRAIFPLQRAAYGEIITLGENDGSSPREKNMWSKMLLMYTRFSRARGIPGVGKYIFKILNKFLYIPSFYPLRNLSQTTFQVQLLSLFIRKGLCESVLNKILQTPLPLVTSFYAPAIAADKQGLQPTFCIICDADLNRVWVSEEPWESNIIYFAPCGKSAQRLQAYGVPHERILLTGFPLPKELLGGIDLSVLKADLGQRLHYLDPQQRFWPLHSRNVEYILGKEQCVPLMQRKLMITYAVGGAGAQKEIGKKIVFSLKRKLEAGQVRINLVAGTSASVQEFFEEVRKQAGPDASANINIIYGTTFEEYYSLFNTALKTTDIMWSKPSELSFYCALGIPFIISPTLGSQEYFNRKWLLEIQAGFKQEDPAYTDQWLFDFLNNGMLAEAAWAGFLKARKLGTFKILEILSKGKINDSYSPLLR